MIRLKNWEEGSPPASYCNDDRVLPLLPTILVSVLAGITGAGLVLYAGYGIIAAIVCYAFFGAATSLLLPLAFYKLTVIKEDSDREACDQLRAEDGAICQFSELEWPSHRGQGNTNLRLHQGPLAMFVAGETKEVRDIRSLLTEIGFDIRDSESLQDAMLVILEAPECWGLLCVDFDSFDGVMDIDTVAEQLASFRVAASGVPVMLMSRSFSLDGFYQIHGPSSIADGCLRIPAEDSSVLRTLKDTGVNNLIWQNCRD